MRAFHSRSRFKCATQSQTIMHDCFLSFNALKQSTIPTSKFSTTSIKFKFTNSIKLLQKLHIQNTITAEGGNVQKHANLNFG